MKIETNIINGFHYYMNGAYLVLNNGNYLNLDEQDTFIFEQIVKCNSFTELYLELMRLSEVEKSELAVAIINEFLNSYKSYFKVLEVGKNDFWISGEKGKSFPLDVVISLTNKCRHNCIHCFREANSSKKELDLNVLRELLDYIYHKVPRIQFTGGEPLLYPHIMEILSDYPDFFFSITTSGDYNEIVEMSLPSKLQYIQISFYGTNPETHDKFAGVKGAFNNAVRSVKRLLRQEQRVILSFMITPSNIEEIENMVRFCLELNAKYITFGIVGKMGKAVKLDSLCLDGEQYNRMIEKISSLQKKYVNRIVFIAGEDSHCSNKEGQFFNCAAGKLSWSVDENGYIYPCSFFQVSPLIMGKLQNYDYKRLIEENLYNNRINKKLIIQRKKIKDFFWEKDIDVKSYCNNINFN